MNRKILQKVIDELKQDEPKLDYIRGILETLIESLPEEKPYVPQEIEIRNIGTEKEPVHIAAFVDKQEPLDEGAMLDMAAKTAMGKMPPIQME